MPDMLTIQGAITGLNTAAQIVKGLIGMKIDAEVSAQVMKLSGEIMSAQSYAISVQSEQLAMLQKIRQLEDDLVRVKAWEEQKERYQLTQVAPGGFVFSLKENSKQSDPAHWICTKCYEDGFKSVLQHNGAITYSDSRMKCSKCKSEVPDMNNHKKIDYV